MRLIAIEQLRVGDRLGRDVWAGGSHIPLLRAGVRLGPSYIEGLRRADVTTVYVDDEISDGITPVPPITDATRREASAALQRAFTDVAVVTAEQGVAKLSDDSLVTLQQLAGRIATDVAASADAAVALADLATVDAYTLQHSVDTTAIGVLIAHRHFNLHGWVDGHGRRRFDKIDQRLVTIGTGLLLHDVGKLAIPTEILQKRGALTPEEWDTIREHPLVGYAMLADSLVLSPLVKAVVRSHHERWDGSGYPSGKAADRIPLFARIAAVADVFDAVTSNRSYKEAAPVHVGVGAIADGTGTLFDPEVVDTFRRTIAPYPVGLAVQLSDGSRGVVSDCPLSAVDRPVVRVVVAPDGHAVEPVEVELARDLELDVVEVDVPLVAA